MHIGDLAKDFKNLYVKRLEIAYYFVREPSFFYIKWHNNSVELSFNTIVYYATTTTMT